MLQSLRKSVDFYKQKLDSITNVNTQQLELLKGLPFYDWKGVSTETPLGTESSSGQISPLGKCCFNHAIGLPQKDGTVDIFDSPSICGKTDHPDSLLYKYYKMVHRESNPLT